MKITIPQIHRWQLTRHWDFIITRINLFVEVEFYDKNNLRAKYFSDFFGAYALRWAEYFREMQLGGPPAFEREEILEILALLNLYFHATPFLKRRFAWMFKNDETHEFAETLKNAIEQRLKEIAEKP
jgi:hypothetical protein